MIDAWIAQQWGPVLHGSWNPSLVDYAQDIADRASASLGEEEPLIRGMLADPKAVYQWETDAELWERIAEAIDDVLNFGAEPRDPQLCIYLSAVWITLFLDGGSKIPGGDAIASAFVAAVWGAMLSHQQKFLECLHPALALECYGAPWAQEFCELAKALQVVVGLSLSGDRVTVAKARLAMAEVRFRLSEFSHPLCRSWTRISDCEAVLRIDAKDGSHESQGNGHS